MSGSAQGTGRSLANDRSRAGSYSFVDADELLGISMMFVVFRFAAARPRGGPSVAVAPYAAVVRGR
jgi:hypothetical protein